MLNAEPSTIIKPLVDTALLPGHGLQHDVVTAAHRVYEHLIAIWAPGVIEAAHDLGVFVELSAGPATAERLAERLDTEPRATRVLMDALYAYDIVERTTEASAPPSYRLPAAMRECLLPGGMFSLVGKIAYDRRLAWRAWQDFAGAVRRGSRDGSGSDQLNQISVDEYESLVSGINFWAPPVVQVLRQGLRDLAWPCDRAVRMVDVGCGTGLYGQLLLREFPQWTAVGLDVARIAPLATSQAAELGVAARFEATVCDFWQDSWGQDVDLILLANIFHLQTPESAETLVRLAAEALAEDGMLCIVDHVVDDERTAKSAQDRFALLFAASMLATGGGDAYTLKDYDDWFVRYGLRRERILETPMHRILLVTRA
ncbi:class I SAM-dependent methyltransferase [Saccharothrix sp. ALI-22-I]|uniref:class I SAM-dependent methyltransferase n=1 Tax=Saccharothrix sp. ALI-22-I TaxID=1933778 RepID=UPI00117ABE3A|nr:class I SAM-dependent methyltransferase [Saccharothrix sp. ALI-22-I]